MASFNFPLIPQPTGVSTVTLGSRSRVLRLKAGYFLLEGVNSFATTLYFYYLYFFLEQQFGFSKKQNLLCAALSGFIYIAGSWYGGRFGQTRGYAKALRFGFLVMVLVLVFGSQIQNAAAHVAVLGFWTLGMSFTWPALEGSISENENRQGLPRMVGLYNLVWAGTSALAYFIGGAILERFGPKSLFLIPAGLHLAQLAMLAWCFPAEQRVAVLDEDSEFDQSPNPFETPAQAPHPLGKAFLRMAWLANPFAYIAINSLIPTIPYVAKRLELSTMFAGFFCSIWLFARLAAFGGLWLWPGWHYRLRWLGTAYVAMILSYVGLLLAHHLWLLIFAQVIFGLAIGLIYYSSLYYSMDVGETKGEHGGLHEAAIGIGNLTGPFIGALALQFFPAQTQSGTWSVGGLLVAGLAALAIVGWSSKRPIRRAARAQATISDEG